ncbi:MAG: exodeoxyribonuclease V subunit beta [Desulfobacteraceae bacterium]|nr:exodeoxyribonuclease V subunit beta [Desulfobacteraceae bacterium]
MQAFDLLRAPLTGVNLIEAGAGTGKTYAIAALYLRLILEQGLVPEEILVVTFTKAATEELQSRIRARLLEAEGGFGRGGGQDGLIQDLVARTADRAQALGRLRQALLGFDRAAIFTIHGFCQRILLENAFETGSGFQTELKTDPRPLLQEVADDFWRRQVYGAPPEFVAYLRSRAGGPTYFLGLLQQLKTPGIRIIPEAPEAALETLAPYRRSLTALRRQWPHAKEAVARLLRDPALSGTVYGSLKPIAAGGALSRRDLQIAALCREMDLLAAPHGTGFPLFEKFSLFTTPKLSAAVRKNQAAPDHPFFALCAEVEERAAALEEEMARRFLFLRRQVFRYAETELGRRKQVQNIQFFDDLLTTVAKALVGPDGGRLLADAVRAKFKAALVDEFQDTDAVQYDIFSRLFGGGDRTLFLIGDPKQAIYSFRGADVFSYMAAARQCDRRYTLTRNWRSAPALITAVNTLFENVAAPFVFEEITFAAGQPGCAPREDAPPSQAPFVVWWLDAAEEKPLAKETAVARIAEAVAGEILGLTRPGPARTEPGDIAVLVRTNRQARQIQRELAALALPAVLIGEDNIFDTPEAAEIQQVLAAILEPAAERRLRAALASDMLGAKASELDTAVPAGAWWADRLAAFCDYLEIWQRSGFYRMFRLLLGRERVKGRLLAYPDGERRLTNLLQLGEILQRAAVENALPPAGLVKWLSQQRDPASQRLEEHQLRLESDAQAVRIITMHKSKGLEFPVVFCPFTWEGALSREPLLRFHDPDADGRLTLDLGDEHFEAHRIQARTEGLAENLRLLYVAVTRAKQRCYLAWGRISTAETSAPAYLLHGASPSGSHDPVGALQDLFKRKSGSTLFEELKTRAALSRGAIELLPLPAGSADGRFKPPAAPPAKLVLPAFQGSVTPSWRITSYTALVSGAHFPAEWPDHDALPAVPAAQSPPAVEAPAGQTDIAAFPRGARAGTFLHDLLEHLDFSADDPDHRAGLVERLLAAYGFDPAWQPALLTMLARVLASPLAAGQETLRLERITAGQRVNEMAFYFPLNTFALAELEDILRPEGSAADFPDLGRRFKALSFRPERGFMKGYIDLVFHHAGRYYLVDWKSNYLGPAVAHYAQANLRSEMAASLYVLQYHLYALALHQLLRLRLPDYRYDTHFGGVFYLFLRGIDPACGPDFGIFHDRPAAGRIAALGKLLIPGFNPL